MNNTFINIVKKDSRKYYTILSLKCGERSGYLGRYNEFTGKAFRLNFLQDKKIILFSMDNLIL